MIFVFKFVLYFIVSFIILSFPVSNKTIFTHLNSVTTPLSHKILQKIETSIHQSSIWSKKIFTNSTPTQNKTSTVQNDNAKSKKAKDLIQGPHTPEERELLEKILKQNK